MDLPEFGAQGPAKVVSIEACPPIKLGAGNVVTGKFIHESDGNLVDLKIEDQQESTIVTANHRYWSADRKQFIEVGHLQPGEQVQTLGGLKQVESITPLPGNEMVYNLEVQGEHVYLVGSLGTLVHNNCIPDHIWINKRVELQVTPGIRKIEVIKPSSKVGVAPYRKVAEYDELGRLRAITDYTDHGRPAAHPVPHHHLFDELGVRIKEIFPGAFPGF